MTAGIRLRAYRSDDFESSVGIWMRAWQTALPGISFAGREQWWRDRWQNELVPNNAITIAEIGGKPEGFVVINPKSGWLDQLAVEPVLWGQGIADALIGDAKRLSSSGIRLDVNQTNARAIRFYERAGFVRTGEGVNKNSGAATFLYEWKP